MKVNELFKPNEKISLESYLTKNGIIDIESYLNPTGKYIEHPFKYEDIVYAVQAFKYHYLQKDMVYIVLDNDGDGIVSTFILYDYMKRLNPKWNIKILIHTGKQRGLDDKDIMDKITNERPSMVIVPDAGSNNYKQAKELADMFMTVICLDHHNIKTPIKHGHLVSNQIENWDVDRCGSGAVVTHKFLKALDIEFDVNYSRDYIDMVAISIISDSMNVTSMQNREYLYWGLFRNSNCIKNEFLKRMFEEFIDKEEYTQRDISFNIVPKFNSIARSEDMGLKQKLLLSFMNRFDHDEMLILCKETHENQIKTVDRVLKENESDIDSGGNVVFFISDAIPRAYSGLIGGKVSNLYDGKPSIVGVARNGKIGGSVRSPIPIQDIINESGLALGEGHSFAFGITMKESNLGKLKDYLNSIELNYETSKDVLSTYSTNKMPKYLFSEFLGYDTLWSNSGLPKPTFHIPPFELDGKDVKMLGSDKRTLKWSKDGIDFLLFRCTNAQKEALGLLEEQTPNKVLVECIVSLGINEFRGRTTNQCIVEEIEFNNVKEKTWEDLF